MEGMMFEELERLVETVQRPQWPAAQTPSQVSAQPAAAPAELAGSRP